jgi:hypothetical protein
MVGPFFRLPFCGFKGRRHPSSRNDFNWQRLETARIATQSQHNCLLTLDMGPRQIFFGEA